MSYTVPARYVPKSIQFNRNGSSITVSVAAANGPAILATLFAVLMTFTILPVIGFIAGGNTAILLFLAALALPIYLFVKGAPKMELSPDGVRIGDKFYIMADISGFREGADDSWLAQTLKLGNLQFLGIQYGIYSVRTPYLLSTIETTKAAPFLTSLLQSLNVEIGAERERKIQQAEVF